MPRRKFCIRCKYRPQFSNRLCKACGEYKRRTGKPRPLGLIVSHYERVSAD